MMNSKLNLLKECENRRTNLKKFVEKGWESIINIKMEGERYEQFIDIKEWTLRCCF